jgi:putative ABC transport system ATP-binding protein
MPLLETEGLTKSYATPAGEVTALAGVDLVIDEGDFVAITGQSGCGKSTLLSLLGLLDVASSGDIRVGGKSAIRLSERQRADIRCLNFGFIFQSFNLIPHLTVLQNVALPLTFRDDVSGKQALTSAAEALRRVGLESFAARFPDQLSGGQQQRAAVARAVVGRPAVIFADEPTGNLDSENGDTVMQLLASLNADGAAVVLVTHDVGRAQGRTHVSMRDGRVVARREPTFHQSERPT